jgi:hypothetical protein
MPKDLQAEYGSLYGLTVAIGKLIARGGTTQDFHQIYCEDCNFTGAKSLDGANFDNAYLSGANFAFVRLRGASFHNADLGGTSFFSADLRNAHLTSDGAGFRDSYERGVGQQVPSLECSNLQGADLSGLPLLYVEKQFATSATSTSDSNISYTIVSPRMMSAQIDASTKLTSIGIMLGVALTDEYLSSHPTTPESQNLGINRNGSWKNFLGGDGWYFPELYRILGESTRDRTTMAIMPWIIQPDGLSRIGDDAFILKGMINQPVLQGLPLYSQFTNVVNNLKLPANAAGAAAKVWSDWVTRTRATQTPLPCDEYPADGSSLLHFDTTSLQLPLYRLPDRSPYT